MKLGGAFGGRPEPAWGLIGEVRVLMSPGAALASENALGFQTDSHSRSERLLHGKTRIHILARNCGTLLYHQRMATPAVAGKPTQGAAQ